MSDYVPDNDAAFDVWQDNLITMAKTNATAYSIPLANITALEPFQAVWVAEYALTRNGNAGDPDKKDKNDAYDAYVHDLRQFVGQWITKNPKISNGDRDRMGLTVPTGVRIPTPVPTTSPVAKVDFSVRLQHTIAFVDAAGLRKAKPKGVHGCEIWIKVGGDVPKDITEFSFVATKTKTPYVHKFTGADASKTAYYRLRWVNTRGEEGPFGDLASATIAG